MKISLLLLLLLIPLASASPLSELLSDDVTQIRIIIDENESFVEYFLNTSGTSFDIQNITYGDTTIENLYISSLLESVQASLEIEEGNQYGQFNSLHINEGSITQILMDNAFSYFDISFRVSDINNNVSIFNDFLIDHPSNISSPISLNLTKEANNYTLRTGVGYGNVPEEYEQRIKNIIEEGFYSLNVKETFNRIVPLLSYNISFLNQFDMDYSVNMSDLDLNISEGEYSFNVEIFDGNETITKEFQLVLGEIPKVEEPEEPIEEEEEDDSSSSSSSRSSTYHPPIVSEPNETIFIGKIDEPIDLTPDKPKEVEEEITFVDLISIALVILVILIILMFYLIKKGKKNE